jgi:hypothetical protein
MNAADNLWIEQLLERIRAMFAYGSSEATEAETEHPRAEGVAPPQIRRRPSGAESEVEIQAYWPIGAPGSAIRDTPWDHFRFLGVGAAEGLLIIRFSWGPVDRPYVFLYDVSAPDEVEFVAQAAVNRLDWVLGSAGWPRPAGTLVTEKWLVVA